ncbi:TrmB family transcriptional regulator [Halococcus saccharolyticus]|uniref:TrmB family transcriptional regulator n=1 Tax=Halococcus saccharolyticus DSM 5350 TaxID=1227455 RepID=M0MMU5_9EURY|nr:helix-turn-helix domain-containing protein [Halococcus saccharolyticus]EMA46698.1 TrmB family transcriptional regulator [Halococcus saccharolyticus DSM 5350]
MANTQQPREIAVAQLEQLGLTEYEASTFVALIQLGTGTAKEVAEIDHVPRTRVYDAVESLHDRGLVDIQHSTPQTFTTVSHETALRKLRLDHENLIARLEDALTQLDPAEPRREELGVWTTTGRKAVTSRALEFIDDTDDELVYMTVDELLTEDHLDELAAAAERGVEIRLAGISEEVQQRVQDRIPEATLFETLWDWEEASAGSLLITDDQTALVSVLLPDSADGSEETAIWGAGEYNSLVVVLRAIFTWRFQREDDE